MPGSVEARAVYLGSDGTSHSTLVGAQASLDLLVEFLVQSPTMEMLHQAGCDDRSGSVVADMDLSRNIHKASGFADLQIQADLPSAVGAEMLSTPHANRVYVGDVEAGVVLSKGESSSQTCFLGRHGAFAARDASGRDVDFQDAVTAYPGSLNPSPGSQGFSSVLAPWKAWTSHESAEAVADPNIDDRSLGGYDEQTYGDDGDLPRQTTAPGGVRVQDVVHHQHDPVIASSTSGAGGGTASFGAPQNVQATPLSSTVAKIHWGGASCANSYRVQWWNGTKAVLLGVVGRSTRSVIVSGLPAGATSRFMIEAVHGSTVAHSPWTAVNTPSWASQEHHA